ncbi:hypothetical protein LBMAG56_22450 [Verrucomicrobiota bacterium]|nr:hypothetical protein LBMAG56_22450 [Verrucomicrobiota bacterium]
MWATARPVPYGGVCHDKREEKASRQLCALVAEVVEDLQRAGKELPPPSTRPMREAIPA